MDHSQSLADFYAICDGIRTKKRDGLTALDLEILELEQFRDYLGGGGSISYFIENADATPSRVASLLTKIGPPKLAALVRDGSKIFPDDMPKDFPERQAFIEGRFEHLNELGLGFETLGGYDAIDSFFCCAGESSIFAAVNAMHGQAEA